MTMNPMHAIKLSISIVNCSLVDPKQNKIFVCWLETLNLCFAWRKKKMSDENAMQMIANVRIWNRILLNIFSFAYRSFDELTKFYFFTPEKNESKERKREKSIVKIHYYHHNSRNWFPEVRFQHIPLWWGVSGTGNVQS